MNTFRTEIALPEITHKISYRSELLMMGSCFTENIGRYLEQNGFRINVNPFGIVYNPASLSQSLETIMAGRPITETELFFVNGLWNHFSFHGKFSHADKSVALQGMNESIEQASNHFKNISHLFLTFGTSWIYREKEHNKIVSNCHKMPASCFTRERLSLDVLKAEWTTLIGNILKANPSIKILLTVSPIRHLKDGSYENQVSKSTLFLLIDSLINTFGSEVVGYFPSYELVMDELRDYRFYASDMTHLSETAEAFVQEKFNITCLDPQTREVLTKIEKINKALLHRPLRQESNTYTTFLEKLENEIVTLMQQYPFVDLKKLQIEIIRKKEA